MIWLIIRSWIARSILKILGWKVVGNTNRPHQEIIIAAPHTSNWDYILMIACAWSMKISLNWIGKKEMFQPWWLGVIFKKMGGISVDRSKKNNIVNSIVNTIISEPKQAIHLAIPPEGTRKRGSKWKSGFYHMAKLARIPITLGYIDYNRKITGLAHSIMATNIEEDILKIRDFYKDIVGKYPEQQNDIVIEIT